MLVLWLIARLWPLLPDASLRQVKRAVRPLLTPQLHWRELAAFFVGWLVVAQAVFHLAKRQRSVDGFLLVIAVVLVGRTFTAGNTLVFAELAAIALLLPVLVLLSRVEDRGRSALIAAVLGSWLVAVALLPALGGAHPVMPEAQAASDFLARSPPAACAARGQGLQLRGAGVAAGRRGPVSARGGRGDGAAGRCCCSCCRSAWRRPRTAGRPGHRAVAGLIVTRWMKSGYLAAPPWTSPISSIR